MWLKKCAVFRYLSSKSHFTPFSVKVMLLLAVAPLVIKAEYSSTSSSYVDDSSWQGLDQFPFAFHKVTPTYSYRV